MPELVHSTNNLDFNIIKIQKLHKTFGAQISGVDFSSPISDEIFDEILAAISKYGVLVFRSTSLDDKRHVEFARRFGELDDIKPYLAAGRKNRLDYDELFDVSNVELDGTLVDPESPRGQANKGNALFHVDSSFNPRRAGYSLLLAHELPPPGTGGSTAFADTRSAFDDLPGSLKEDLLTNNYIANHSLLHSKKLAAPEYFAKLNPAESPMGRHRLVQVHESSGRMNLYIAAHAHHIEGMDPEASKELLDRLYGHAKQPRYVFEVEWENVGDLVIWDNTCVMHRAVGGSFEGKYKRDMRRATVHDGSSQAWGLNEHTDQRQGLP
ncbi:related to 2,4-dichlorophenoxyacetate dioxygenase [Phialocephala subalpina]|uniref:Related to 2,4-dichlorophenoxyacetate dioxygenase n=1 Tax=Phialocephala subalpina TaxID=576137 RepID=A0A1L7XRE2_9HELO|nr:related to 2,4-dichlorophenoxyacetate dioxygenase [Phialocephala subalpina]